MSQDNPTIEEILITVKEFAQGVAQRSSGAERYDGLCAAFLMGVVQRELNLGTQQDDDQLVELQSMLGTNDDLAELYRRFSINVRKGSYDKDWQSAFDFAFKQVVDKVKVTNPDHLEEEHR
ncbi:MAG: hypothetical protein COC20_06760 [Cellvibrionales bacterium]|nr:MAG: hypothetical protein COC20_06760 [Cellvibrionales bacterium]